jgi:hypothetical protein
MKDDGSLVSTQIGDPSGFRNFWQLYIQTSRDIDFRHRAYYQKKNLSEYRFSKWKSRLVNDSDAGRFVRIPLMDRLLVPTKRGVVNIY